MVPSSTYPDGQLALVVQARGRLLLVFLFRRSRVVAQGKCRVGGSAETLQCKRQIQAFPTSSQPHPQGAPRGDVTCTTTVLLQWNLARGARELQSRLEYVPVPVVIPKKTEQNGQKQHCPAMCNVCREPSSTLQREASREQSLPAWTQLVRTCCDSRTCQSLQLHRPRKPGGHQLCPPHGMGTHRGKIRGAGWPQAAQPKWSPKFPTPGRAGAFGAAPAACTGWMFGLCLVSPAGNIGSAGNRTNGRAPNSQRQ